MSVIRWEEPPPPSLSRSPEKRRLEHWAIAECLRRRPGVWALVAEGSWFHTLTSQIKFGSLAPYRPAGSFDAVARQVGDATRLYAKYVGDPSAVGGEPEATSKESSDLGGDAA